MNNNNLYIYKATYLKNYDGDTITFLVDMGMGSYRKENIRLYGINTYELRDKNAERRELAYEAKRFVEVQLVGTQVYIKTYKDKTGKYGRYLAEVFLEGNDKSLNEMLLDEGLAEPYE